MGTMSRREVVAAGAAWAGGLGTLAACTGREGWPAPAAAAPAADARKGAASFLETGDGTSLFYLDWGSGAPVVFTHAWALNADLWEYQMIALTERGLRCVAYDRRGHGRSRDPGGGYDFDTLADDLARVLDALDLRDVTLVGHSMGCGEIARYLSRHGTGRISTRPFERGQTGASVIAARSWWWRPASRATSAVDPQCAALRGGAGV